MLGIGPKHWLRGKCAFGCRCAGDARDDVVRGMGSLSVGSDAVSTNPAKAKNR